MDEILDEAGHSEPDGAGPIFSDPLGRMLYRVSRLAAVLGGLILVGLSVMLCVTIFSRKIFLWQVTGDYELVQMLGAFAGSLLFPWCAIVGGNVVVDLLTAGLPKGLNRLLDRFGYLLLCGMALLLAWRTGVLAVDSRESHAISAMLSWPLWVWQALMVPGLALTGIISLYMALAPRALAEREAASEEGPHA
ncbi:MAG: TRAP transporter small permease [Flavobacteriaceae bacterium]